MTLSLAWWNLGFTRVDRRHCFQDLWWRNGSFLQSQSGLLNLGWRAGREQNGINVWEGRFKEFKVYIYICMFLGITQMRCWKLNSRNCVHAFVLVFGLFSLNRFPNLRSFLPQKHEKTWPFGYTFCNNWGKLGFSLSMSLHPSLQPSQLRWVLKLRVEVLVEVLVLQPLHLRSSWIHLSYMCACFKFCKLIYSSYYLTHAFFGTDFWGWCLPSWRSAC